jgi:hypothetical protein
LAGADVVPDDAGGSSDSDDAGAAGAGSDAGVAPAGVAAAPLIGSPQTSQKSSVVES